MGCLGLWVLSVLLGASLWLVNGAAAGTTAKELQEGLQDTKHGEPENKVKQNAAVCQRSSCGRGRECVVRAATGRAECVCQERCHSTFVPVCGSDGRFYQNHCELYRSACVRRRTISALHSKHCFLRGDACTMAEYNKLKSILMDMQPQSSTNAENSMAQRRTLVLNMFTYFDRNQDGRVSSEELAEISVKEHLENVLLECSMQDLLRYDDYNNDGHLTLQELYTAFQVIELSLAEDRRLSVSTVTVGLSVVLSCAVQGSLRPPIIWKRNGIILNFLDLEDINDFGDDGSLYITKVTTIHMGNYSCHAHGYEELSQTHLLQVNVPPVILVYPETQAQEPGVAASLRCHADGVPNPKLTWLKNGMDLQPHGSKQISLLANGSELHISSVRYEDTGAYTCIARNEVGVDEDISSLFVEDSARKTLANILWREEGLSVGNMFYVFSNEGITVLQPGNCEIRRHITHTERILGTHEELCPRISGVSSQECVWSSAVSVREKYVFVSQPLLNRLLVMDTQAQRVVQAVETDAMPVKLFYDKSHDQLWVLSWRDLLKSRSTLQVITSASTAAEQRQIIRTQFERVQDFYIPPTNLIITHVRFGFVYLKSEPAVHKVDLETLRVVKSISLQNFSCFPLSMAYTHLSGYYFIECQSEKRPTFQLLIDAVSDAIIGRNPNIHGQPFISPNGRFVVSVDKQRGKLQVQSVSISGELQIHYEADAKMSIADLEFQPSFTDANEFTAVVSSARGSKVLFLDLATGRIKTIGNVKNPVPASSWPWGDANRMVISSGVFGRYLLTSSADSMFILDGKQSAFHCEVSDVKFGNTAVWVGEV
ncbi:follistatin-related protein 4 isoform X1 [Danio rerio]|uniref:Follistatin-like 4 n=2 Tax=Danio rerio TaxID=7955 RepID=A0A8M9PQK6_DANRE|nr:follistatin-related protein 4 precursor [Danio rerio]XP_021324571.1 follistatin-related protein 4 isoform X1 [Danio rerio]|eukprot:XP_021324571.1 follistatin-related protein 4 isoform X1 [Danio rerio]